MAIQIITWLLIFAVFYMIVTAVIFFRNRFDLTPLLPKNSSDENYKISVCIPARNEENSLENLLCSLENQDWPNYEVHILDDQSTDQTFEIAHAFHQKNPDQFYIHKGEEKPDDWLGKPWACHQLSQNADGDILLFLDADTKLFPGSLKKIAASLTHYHLDMLTVWPEQKLVTFWEKTVLPVIFYSLFSILPSIYVYRDPKWMPKSLRKIMRPRFAAACGQCIAFKLETYEAIGGHQSVKDQIVEDVELAKIIQKKGFTMRMFTGLGSVSCRMYHNHQEIFEGLRKNFFAGFNHSIPVFLTAALLHFLVFLLPFLTLFISLAIGNWMIFTLSFSVIALICILRVVLAKWYRLNLVYAFTHPIGVLWFEVLALIKIGDYLFGKSANWKGRKV